MSEELDKALAWADNSRLDEGQSWLEGVVEENAKVLAAELRRQSQELEAIKAVARESAEALARYCGQRKYRKIHLRQVFAAVDTLASLTQPAQKQGEPK